MKTCSKCKTEKLLSEFHRRGNSHQHWCKNCAIAARVNYYVRNKDVEKNKVQKRIKELTEWNHLLKSKPCVDCNNIFHPSAMQWDHRDRTTKKSNISDMIRNGLSKKTILKEIKKCDLRCSNCHSIKTWFENKAK